MIPAYCSKCGIMVPVPIGVGGGPVEFANCTATCPRCGAVARILDGVYTSAQTVLGEIVQRRLPADRLRRLRSILEQQKQASPRNAKSVAEAIQKEAPEIQNLRDCLPQTRMELYTLLGILIAALGLLIGSEQEIPREAGHCSEEPYATKKTVNISNETRVDLTNKEEAPVPLPPTDINDLVQKAMDEALQENEEKEPSAPRAPRRRADTKQRARERAARRARRKNR